MMKNENNIFKVNVAYNLDEYICLFTKWLWGIFMVRMDNVYLIPNGIGGKDGM